jgi:hypothetical protein
LFSRLFLSKDKTSCAFWRPFCIRVSKQSCERFHGDNPVNSRASTEKKMFRLSNQFVLAFLSNKISTLPTFSSNYFYSLFHIKVWAFSRWKSE